MPVCALEPPAVIIAWFTTLAIGVEVATGVGVEVAPGSGVGVTVTEPPVGGLPSLPICIAGSDPAPPLHAASVTASTAAPSTERVR